EPEPTPPPVPTPDAPPIDDVKFIDPFDVFTWAETSQIRAVDITRRASGEAIADVCIDHTKRGEWPAVTPESVTVEGCHWVIFQTPKGWVGCTYEWYRPGSACKKFYIGNLHRTVRADWNVKSGDRVGFMVSTLARDSNRSPRNERSSIFWTVWP